ncbi:ROK family glucokinase [Aurantimicrobium minutum]|uniref:ROK family glucokinase n=1 Tax=Aurantimicrobium minutum TaxID=708131 RepID=UPI0024736D93|nr:ROK family glucokinase [Aurantimicrobium minutum]MDH6422716.1 glucokinase [Aurantimicrobium minutum]
MYSIGIDIGGTKIAGALVNDLGEILEQRQVPSPAHSAQQMEDSIVELIQELSQGNPVKAAGVAAAGFIDAAQSTVYYAPNIAWRNEPLKDKLEARINLPIVIENDANAAGWAEYRFGAGKSFTHMTMLTIGTGVGGAIIANGELFTGGFGAGAEIGHLRVQPDGLECGCGQRGCIESYGSGRALLRYLREETGNPALDANEGKKLLEDGDPAAWRALETLGSWLGIACASLSAVLDPQVYVIGGGVAAAGEHLLQPIRESFLTNLSAQGYHPEPEFRIAQLANDAGVVGAADLARKHAEKL